MPPAPATTIPTSPTASAGTRRRRWASTSSRSSKLLGLLREFQEGTTPCGLPFTFAENPRIANFSARHDAGLPAHVFVTLDDRFEIALIRSADGLSIEVYPITGGVVWDNPFDRFEVDEEVIRKLEQEMGDD